MATWPSWQDKVYILKQWSIKTDSFEAKMPRPSLPIRRPIKLKKAAVKKDKDAGAIVRDPSNRRKPLEADSCQSVSVPF